LLNPIIVWEVATNALCTRQGAFASTRSEIKRSGDTDHKTRDAGSK
jgi:hypothetical protein